MFKELDNLINNPSVSLSPKKIHLYEGERREVSVLFADIKGFTTLSLDLDHEQLRIILDKTMQIFTQSVKKFGGYVDKYEGDLIMALFGAKKATVNDTERAILCAMEIIDNLRKINIIIQKSLKKFNLDIRIGINTGLVTTGKIGEKREGDFTVYGSAVNLASRMESNAPINKIMLPKKCADIVKNKFSFKSHSLISVKGFPKPIKTVLVKARISEQLGKTSGLFIGRKSELSQLNNNYYQFQKAKSQAKSPIIITGQCGIGKTRLINEFLNNKNFKFIFKSTFQFLNPVPFSGLKSLIGSFFQISTDLPESKIRQRLKTKFNEMKNKTGFQKPKNIDFNVIVQLFCNQQVVVSDKSAENNKLVLFAAIKDLFLIFAELAKFNNHPLLIIMDNYNDIDNLSDQFFNYLIEFINFQDNPSQYNLLVIISSQYYNPSAISVLNDQNIMLLTIKSINRNDVKQLIEYLDTEQKLTLQYKKILVDKSQGIPLFIVEFFYLLSNLNDNQNIENLEIPRSIKAVITSRYDSLNKDTKLILQIASVFGSEFRCDVIEQIASQLELSSSVIEILNYLTNLEYFISLDNNSYLFVHNLTHEIIYNLILKQNRKILHLKIAQELDSFDTDLINRYLYDLVEHYHKGENQIKYHHYLKKAGIYAKEKYDFKKAEYFLSEYYRIYQENTDANFVLNNAHINTQQNIEDILEVLWYLIKVKQYLGEYLQAIELAQHLLKFSISTNNIKYQASSYNFLGDLYQYDRDYPSAYINYKQAEQLYIQIEDLFHVSIITGFLGEIKLFNRDFKHADKLFNIQQQQCEKLVVHQQEALGYYYNNMAIFYFQQDNFKKAAEFHLKDLETSRKLNQKVDIAQAHGHLGFAYLMQNKLNKAQKHLTEYLHLSEKLFFKSGLLHAYDYLGKLEFKRKNYIQTLKYAQQQLKIAEQISSKCELGFSYNSLALIHLKTGDINLSKTLIKKALALAYELQDILGITVLNGKLGLIMKYQHCYYQSQQKLKEVINKLIDLNAPSYLYNFIAEFVEICLITGNTDKIIQTLNRFSPIEYKYDDLINFQIKLINKLAKIKKPKTLQKVINEYSKKTINKEKTALLNFYLFLTYRNFTSISNCKQVNDFKNTSIKMFKKLTGTRKIYPYYFYMEILQSEK